MADFGIFCQKSICDKSEFQIATKREEAAWLLLFLNNNDPVFFIVLFSGPYFGPDFFQGHKPTNVFKTRIVNADWLGVSLPL